MEKHRGNNFEIKDQARSPQWLKKVYNYYRGDMHIHSRWSERSGVEDGGREKWVYNEERLLNYVDRLGLEFVILTEHGSDPGAPVELSEEHPICQSLLAEQAKVAELDAADKYKAKAYVGVEASIFFNQEGKAVLDIPDVVLAKLDLVIASRYAITDEREPAKIKESLLAAVNHPELDVIGHPYRNIEFYQHDWRYFKKYWQNKDKEIYQQLIDLEQAEDWQSIKQIIGKLEPGNDEQIKRLSQMF